MEVETIDMDAAFSAVSEIEQHQQAAVPALQEVAAISKPTAGPLALLNSGIADLDKLERLWELQVRFEQREAEKAFNEAFAAFKAESISIVKNVKVSDGPLKGKSYADLFAVVDAVTPALSRHGFSASWKTTKDEPQWIEVTCTLKHVLGHSTTEAKGGPPDTGPGRNAIQARASATSYLERYSLKSILGVAVRGEDNDGHGDGKKPVSVLELVFDNLILQLQATTVDTDAAKLWSIGSKVLHAAGDTAAFAEFKERVVQHRTALKERAAA